MATGTSSPDKLSIVVYAGFYDKVHYALVMASSAAAIDRPVTLFFTMGACHVLKRPDDAGVHAWRAMPLSEEEGTGGDKDDAYAAMKVATFEELLQSCVQFGVTFMVLAPEHPLIDELKSIDLTAMSPMEAFDVLRDLSRRASDEAEH